LNELVLNVIITTRQKWTTGSSALQL